MSCSEIVMVHFLKHWFQNHCNIAEEISIHYTFCVKILIFKTINKAGSDKLIVKGYKQKNVLTVKSQKVSLKKGLTFFNVFVISRLTIKIMEQKSWQIILVSTLWKCLLRIKKSFSDFKKKISFCKKKSNSYNQEIISHNRELLQCTSNWITEMQRD